MVIKSDRTRSRNQRWHNAAGERGGLDIFMVLVLSTLIAFAGLAYDMGMFFNAHREAQAIAASAARAGADQVKVDNLYGDGEAKIDESEAKSAARKHIPAHATERNIDVTNNDEQILVEITIDHEPLILSAFGLGTMEASGEAIARVANEAP